MTATGAESMLTVGGWTADHAAGTLSRDGERRPVEPKVMDLLVLLASRPEAVLSKAELLAALWPGLTVGDDALARCVWKLRGVLSDDPKAPRFIETIPKRGYRLIAPVTRTPLDDRRPRPAVRPIWRRPAVAAAGAVLVVLAGAGLAWRQDARAPGQASAAALTRRADDFYYQFTRADNEAAIALYERVLADRPDHAPALAGLAEALVQKTLRWPNDAAAPPLPSTDLAGAIAQGRLSTPPARARLSRALALAGQAVRLAPRDASAQGALGLVLAAQGRFDEAERAYRRAAALDPDAWTALVELGDLAEMRGDHPASLRYLERAFEAMTRVYDRQSSRIRPWYADFGVLIADRYAALGAGQQAELWYRRVLGLSPLQPAATSGLARLLARSGDPASAGRLCRSLVERIGHGGGCDDVLAVAAGRVSRPPPR
ncbi:hypothetical protein C5708_10815 [Caulobacter sp. CCUG 60055]|uniref:winged helix-turn-helix domain-containing protein n=1 Tax=Caulobacter sp. CCUG 60055 TaxID=2100090 RepID=UPI001FA7405C|nr:transcriptional regulator [Caulobacter sp. CCUG 60055]MCI3180749.1 hypothetical protein [Caulobacter sp. CCUG 60055]